MSVAVDPRASLADLVIGDPRRSQVLTELGLDFCCNGERPLADAVEQAGLVLSEVAAQLDLPAQPQTGAQGDRSQSMLAHEIVDTHHAYMWEEMPRLTLLVNKVVAVHGDAHPELAQLRLLYEQMVQELDPHMTSEERVVFPAISRLERTGSPGVGRGPESLAEPIRKLRDEHQLVGELLQEMREITGDYAVPADACTTYTLMLDGLEKMDLDLREHIHKENNILFPKVLALETQTDQT